MESPIPLPSLLGISAAGYGKNNFIKNCFSIVPFLFLLSMLDYACDIEK